MLVLGASGSAAAAGVSCPITLVGFATSARGKGKRATDLPLSESLPDARVVPRSVGSDAVESIG